MSVNIGKVQRSIPFLQSHRDDLRRLFYNKLWERYPRLARSISDTDRNKITLGFSLLLDNLLHHWHDFQASEEIMRQLAHTSLGHLFNEGFIAVATHLLLETMRELFGDDWNDDLEASWDEALGVQRVMFLKATRRFQTSAEEAGILTPAPSSD